MKFDDQFPKELPCVQDLIRVAYEGDTAGTINIVESSVTTRVYNAPDEFLVTLGDGLLLSASYEKGVFKWKYAEEAGDVPFGKSPQIFAVKVLWSPWSKK